jgi:hypothetical protein
MYTKHYCTGKRTLHVHIICVTYRYVMYVCPTVQSTCMCTVHQGNTTVLVLVATYVFFNFEHTLRIAICQTNHTFVY